MLHRSKIAVCVDTAYLSPHERKENACIIVEREKIASIEESPRGAETVYDYRGAGSIALPGIVDMHVHLRGLKQSYKEDEESGTKAAARAGITLVADMPNTEPYLDTEEAVREKLEALKERAVVDYAVYSGVPSSYKELEKIARLPVIGFKIYPLDYSKTILCKLFAEASKRNMLVIIHPEDPHISRVEPGWSRKVYYNCVAELAAIEYMLSLYHSCGEPRIHFTHISCPNALKRVVREAKKDKRVSCDTTPHHLLVSMKTNSLYADYCYEKVNPPLRSPLESWTLFQKFLEALASDIDSCSIASDHAPHAAWEKSQHPLLCPPGIASIECWPGAIGRVAEKKLLDLLVASVSVNPSRILGLRDRGALRPGATASLTVLGSLTRSIAAPEYSKASHSYYSMLEKLETLLTVVRGRPVYAAGEGILVDPGYGKNVVNSKLALEY